MRGLIRWGGGAALLRRGGFELAGLVLAGLVQAAGQPAGCVWFTLRRRAVPGRPQLVRMGHGAAGGSGA